MYNFQKKGFGALYILFVFTFLGLFGIIVLNQESYYSKIYEKNTIEYDILNNILYKNKYNINFHKDNNINNGHYKDMLLCPDNINYYSGSTLIRKITSTRDFKNNMYFCSNIDEGLSIYYDENFSGFTGGVILGNSFNIIKNGNIFESSVFFDSDYIDFNIPNELYNDSKRRKEYSGYILSGSINNVFWINDDIRNFINKNPNNISSLSKKISDIEEGYLFLNISNESKILIIEIDKNIYSSNGKIIKKDEILSKTFSSGFDGYLQSDKTFSSLIGDPYLFDFKNKDYAIFIERLNSNLNYNLYFKDLYGNGIFISPILEDEESIIFLGNDILKNKNGFYGKMNIIKNDK